MNDKQDPRHIPKDRTESASICGSGESRTKPPENDANCIDGTDQKDLTEKPADCIDDIAQTGVRWPCESIKRGLTLFTDFMARVFFKDQTHIVEYLLRLVTGNDGIVITDMALQKPYTNVNRRSVQADIAARGNDGVIYDIEIQKSHEKNIVERSVFYAAAIMTDEFPQGKDFSHCPRVRVVFLLRNGEACNNRLVRRLRLADDEGIFVDSPLVIYFVNGALRDDSALGKIMQDMRRSDLRAFEDPVFKQRMDDILDNPLWRKTMCDAEYEWAAELLEEGEKKGRADGEAKGRAMGREEGRAMGREEGRTMGREEGRTEGILLTARNMIAQALNDGLIATVTGLPIAEVQALRAEMPR